MNEAEWEHHDSPSRMLAAIPKPRDSRKLIRFAVACCSQDAMVDDEWKNVVSEITDDVLSGKTPLSRLPCLFGAFSFDTEPTAEWWASSVTQERTEPRPEYSTQAAFLRCIFGNPFRPVALDRAWRTEAVVGLATGIYSERSFERMPVLADALEDAGCAHPDVLTHCRDGGPHARGCWVVDLLIGKA